eukprot:536356-Prorocentrum_minimum.AAC.1
MSVPPMPWMMAGAPPLDESDPFAGTMGEAEGFPGGMGGMDPPMPWMMGGDGGALAGGEAPNPPSPLCTQKGFVGGPTLLESRRARS